MKYEIRFKREVVNSLLHILIGGVLIYVFVPTRTAVIAVLVALAAGAIRELLQYWRGKSQPVYISIIDAVGFAVGAALYVWIRDKIKLKPDEM